MPTTITSEQALINRMQSYDGNFDTLSQASEAYIEASKNYFGNFHTSR